MESTFKSGGITAKFNGGNMDTKDKIIQWLLSGHTGISSKAIVSQMTGFKTHRWADHPRDGGDFERCHRLLVEVPEFMVRIEEMAQRSPQWAVLVDHWHELTQHYLISGRDGIYERITRILEKVPNKNRIDLGNGVAIEIIGKD